MKEDPRIDPDPTPPIFGDYINFDPSRLLSTTLPIDSRMSGGPDVKRLEDANDWIFGTNEFIPDSDQVRRVCEKRRQTGRRSIIEELLEDV